MGTDLPSLPGRHFARNLVQRRARLIFNSLLWVLPPRIPLPKGSRVPAMVVVLRNGAALRQLAPRWGGLFFRSLKRGFADLL